MAGERTVNPYATEGPAHSDGETWHDYFRRILGRDVDSEPEQLSGDDDELDDELESGNAIVLDRGSVDEYGDSVPGAVTTWLKLLAKKEWMINSGWTRTFFEGGVYGKTAKKAGEKKPDRTIETFWVEGFKDGNLVRFTYQRTNSGKFTCTWRQLNKQYKPVSDVEMKEFVNGEGETYRP